MAGEAFWLPLTATEAGEAHAELLVQDGTSPPEPLTLEDGSDYLYEDV